MAWNQQNDEGDNKPRPEGERPDPWGRSPRGPRRPPDMDEFLKKLVQTLRRLLLDAGDWRLLVLVLPVLLGLWLVSGFYVVQPSQQGVVLRLGLFNDSASPGLHWRLPLIDSVRVIDVGGAHQLPLSVALMTADESMVDLDVTVDYRVSDLRRYTDAMADPEALLARASESALRQAVGNLALSDALDTSQPHLPADLPARVQQDMDRAGSGITVTSLRINQSHLPKEVQPAADALATARQHSQAALSQAQARAGQQRAEATTQAAQLVADATAYKTEALDRAQAQADRFAPLLAEYHKSPALVRERVYMEAMEAVLGKASVVVVADKDLNPNIYLPGDKGAPRASASSAPAGGKQP